MMLAARLVVALDQLDLVRPFEVVDGAGDQDAAERR
jgi:hypothetical protein